MNLEALQAGLREAIGRQKIVEDCIAPSLVERLAATLECDAPAPREGEPLPAGWHTIFCLQAPPRAGLGDDGLPTRYDLIPPVPMQRRLFGGARLELHAPLLVGDRVACESELADVKVRSTTTAHLAIATLRHRFFGSAGLAVVEEQDIVHMEPASPGATGDRAGSDATSNAGIEKAAGPNQPRPTPTWQRTTTPDSLTLFRFSALTFNSHRIHYDAPYAENVEKLPGLVVQGKLIALQILETVRRAAPEAAIKQYHYRSTRPAYAGGRYRLAVKLGESGSDAQSWAEDGTGDVVQTASLRLAGPLCR